MLKKYVAPHIKTIVLVLLSMFLTAFLELLPPYFISIVLDRCLPESNYKLIIILAFVLIVSYLVVMFNQKWRSKRTNGMAMNIIKSIRYDLFCHMQQLPFSFFDSRPHGKILVRVVNYVNTISNLLANGIFDMITNIFKMFVIVGFMLAMDINFTLVCLMGLPVFAAILLVIKTKHRRAWQRYSSKWRSSFAVRI